MNERFDTRHSRWAGADLLPLPYESMTSTKLLFTWLNGMTYKSMVQEDSLRQLMDTAFLFRAKDNTGFPIRSHQCDYPLETYRQGVYHTWISRSFRYCPLCLEAGYHSALYQILSLMQCPFHQVPLSDRCHSCKAITPDLDDSRKLFSRPYCCAECDSPISGAKLCIDSMAQFRDTFSQVASALKPVGNWWLDVEAAHRHIRADLYEACNTDEGHWWDATDFVKGVIEKQGLSHRSVRPSRYTNEEIVTLNWVCRYADHVPTYTYDRFGSSRGQKVYRYTLERLKRWVLNVDGLSSDQFHSMIADYCFDESTGGSARLQAFMAFRCHLEDAFVLGGADLAPV